MDLTDATFVAYLFGLCLVAFAATQHARPSSLPAIALRTVGGLSGLLAQGIGWTRFYVL